MKKCADCGVEQPMEAFPRNRTTKDGRGSYCKPCHNERNRQALARNGGARRYHLRTRYRMDLAEVEAILASQAGLCAASVWSRPPTSITITQPGW